MLINFYWMSIGAYFIIGNICFGLSEYIIHRLLHVKPKAKAKYDQLTKKTHNLHHRLRLSSTLPMIVGDVLGASMAVVVTSLYMGFSPVQNIVWCGFVSGYALYIVYHDSAHRDRSNGIADINGRYFHVLHHAADKNRNYTTNFGVTTITWDWLFGTIDKKMTFSLNGIIPAVIPLCAPFSFRYFLVRKEHKEFPQCEELELSY